MKLVFHLHISIALALETNCENEIQTENRIQKTEQTQLHAIHHSTQHTHWRTTLLCFACSIQTAQHILQTSRKQINSIYFLKRKYQVICFDTHLYRTLLVRMGFMAFFFYTRTLLLLYFACSLRFYIYN